MRPLNTDFRIRKPDGSTDPRSRADFQPRHYPRVNGQEPPPPTATERNDRIQLEFLAAYYDLNCENARLLEARREAVPPARGETEKKILQNVERLLIVRDGLEDQYAPLGVIAEPIVKDGFTVNVILSFGNVDAAGRRRSELYTITARVPIPLPEGVRFEDLDLRIEGPGINPP
jgi:hypothetical protein